MSTNKNSIHILRGRTSSTSEPNAVDNTPLEAGQPFYDKRTNTLRIGDGTNAIKNVKPVTVADGAITTDKLHDASNTNTPTGVITDKIEDKAITTEKIDDKAITTAKLADANNDRTSPTGITTEKIEDRAITSDKLGNITKIALTTGKKSSNYITTWRESSGVVGQVTIYRSKQLNQTTTLKENVVPIIWGDIVVFARTGVEAAEPAVKGRSLYLETTKSSELTDDTDYYANKRFTRISEDSIGLNVALNTDSVSGAIRLGYPSKSGTLALQSQIPTIQSIDHNLYITTT